MSFVHLTMVDLLKCNQVRASWKSEKGRYRYRCNRLWMIISCV